MGIALIRAIKISCMQLRSGSALARAVRGMRSGKSQRQNSDSAALRPDQTSLLFYDVSSLRDSHLLHDSRGILAGGAWLG